MNLIDAIKNLPKDVAEALQRVAENGATVGTGFKITISIGADAEDLDGLSLEELTARLEELQLQFDELEDEEPEDENSEEYEEWEDALDELEEQIDDIQDAIDQLKNNPPLP